MGSPTRSLQVWARTMARHYAREIPDYARLHADLLERDVALVSYEYLLAVWKEEDEGLEALALAVGERRQRQGVSLPGLLRAYRLWAKDALEALKAEAPGLLVEAAPRVAEVLDRVSEASALGYRLALKDAWPLGPVTGVGVALGDAGALVYAPRHLPLGPEGMAFAQAPGGALLLLQAPFKEVERGLRELAQSQAAVLWVGEGPREEVQKDLEEALLLGPLLRLPPGLYPVRFLWPLSLALESRRGQERLLRLVQPLEGQPDLLKTLEAYLGARLSLKAAARRLGLHPNTVLYRLHRAEELTGLSLERVEDLCLLQIALQLREALNAGPPG